MNTSGLLSERGLTPVDILLRLMRTNVVAISQLFFRRADLVVANLLTEYDIRHRRSVRHKLPFSHCNVRQLQLSFDPLIRCCITALKSEETPRLAQQEWLNRVDRDLNRIYKTGSSDTACWTARRKLLLFVLSKFAAWPGDGLSSVIALIHAEPQGS